MGDYYDPELTPAPDRHEAAGFPYPQDSTGDVHPGQSPNQEDNDRVFPYPIDSSGDEHPQVDRHDGGMNMNMGRTKGHL